MLYFNWEMDAVQVQYNIRKWNSVFEELHSILYSVWEAHRDTAYKAVTHVLVKATHVTKGTITPVSAFIDVKLMFKRKLLWPVWKHHLNIITKCMRTTREIHIQNSGGIQPQFNLQKQFRQYNRKWCYQDILHTWII